MPSEDASAGAVRAALASASAAILKDAALAEKMVKAQDDARRKEAGKADARAAAPAAASPPPSSPSRATPPRDALLALKAEVVKAAVLFSPSSAAPSEEVARGFLASLCRVSAAAQLALRGAGGPAAGASLRDAAGKEASRLAALCAAALMALAESLGSGAGAMPAAPRAASAGQSASTRAASAGQSASTRAVAAAATAVDEAAGRSWDDVSVMVSDLIKPLKALDEAHRDLSEAIREGEEAAGSPTSEPAAHDGEDDGFGLSDDVLNESEIAVAKLAQQVVVSVGKMVRRAAASLVASRRDQSLDDGRLARWKAYAPLCTRAARLGDAVAGDSLAPQDASRVGGAAEKLRRVAAEAAPLAQELGQDHVDAVQAMTTAVDAVLEAVEE